MVMNSILKKTATFRRLVGVVATTACTLLTACGGSNSKSTAQVGTPAMDSTLVIAMLGDADYLNPVLAGTVTSSNIVGLMSPSLLQSEFDTTTGLLNYMALEKKLRAGGSSSKMPQGAVAKSWTMSADHTTLTYTLRSDAFWSDGKPVVAEDFKFTYQLYGNPLIASARQQYLAELVGADKGQIDFNRAIEAPNDTTLIFRFYKPVPEHLALFHTSLAPLPAHQWKGVKAEEFRQSPLNLQPLSAGPYRLTRWTQQQEIVLGANRTSTLPKPGNIPTLSFRVVPDYTVRLAQLQTGAVDVVENIKPEDFSTLKQAKQPVDIKTLGLRAYDYIGWSNIDFTEYRKNHRIKPHPLFGSPTVRLALTQAIDREAIIDGYLREYGVVCNTDISPSLKWAYNNKITPHPYDPAKAKALLAADGWKYGADGILQKQGKRFSFVLHTNAGNARRNYASVIIQQNLRAIGIECKLEVQESNVFFENLQQRKLDAWLAGWAIGLEIDPLDTWGSNLEKSRFNFTGYQNPRIEQLSALAKQKMEPTGARPYWLEYQEILHRDQPITFLYWMKETHGFSRRIQGAELNIAGAFYNLDDWKLQPSASIQ
uniref:Peptide ABC transporter, periplasmic peptide-binding protein n=1 Tax=Chlorobium chlorochromatii (strain CaD3) TaxID=340177 RepID=Q3APQ9_CHLCH